MHYLNVSLGFTNVASKRVLAPIIIVIIHDDPHLEASHWQTPESSSEFCSLIGISYKAM